MVSLELHVDELRELRQAVSLRERALRREFSATSDEHFQSSLSASLKRLEHLGRRLDELMRQTGVGEPWEGPTLLG